MTSCTKHDFHITVFRAVKQLMMFVFELGCTFKIFKYLKRPSNVYKTLKKTIKDLRKTRHYHKTIILHKFYSLIQYTTLSHEKRTTFRKTKYNHLPYNQKIRKKYFCCSEH